MLCGGVRGRHGMLLVWLAVRHQRGAIMAIFSFYYYIMKSGPRLNVRITMYIHVIISISSSL